MNFKEEDDGRVIVWRTGEDHSQPEKYDDQRIGGIDRRKDGKSNVQTESDTAAREQGQISGTGYAYDYATILGCPFRLSIFPEDPQEDAHMMQYANLVGGPKRSRKQKAENETEEMVPADIGI